MEQFHKTHYFLLIYYTFCGFIFFTKLVYFFMLLDTVKCISATILRTLVLIM